MSIFKKTIGNRTSGDAAIDPFEDPVAYLAGFGIEAELIEVRLDVPEAA